MNTNFKEGEILLFDKPLTWTSFQLVKKVKFQLEKRLKLKKIKVGHAGTLDPLADGLMIICTGKKTKEIQSFQDKEKEYVASIRIGATTPSFDLETQIDNTFPTEHITEELLKQKLSQFVGEQLQTPPVFSAKQINGKRAYDYARAGKEVKMNQALIHITEIELLSEFTTFPDIQIRVVCSKGTYIRSLAHDLGKTLDSGAHLTHLRRTRIGNYSVTDAQNVDDFVQLIISMECVDNFL